MDRSQGSSRVVVVGVASSVVWSGPSVAGARSPSGDVTVTTLEGSGTEGDVSTMGVGNSAVWGCDTLASAASGSGGGEPTALAALVAALMAVTITLAGEDDL